MGLAACAPLGADGSGVYAAAKVCVPNDGAPYHGCNGSTTCSGAYDCMQDFFGDKFCTKSGCANDSVCGPGGSCKTLVCDNAFSSCSGSSKGNPGPGCTANYP
jgi:hypothetical protein